MALGNKDLITLLKAFGSTGASGQSFLTNVLGAASGVRLTDYLVSNWGISGGPDNVTNYTNGQQFALTISFTQGAQASQTGFKKIGNVLQGRSNTSGASISIVTSSIVAAASGSTGTIALYGPSAGASLTSVTGDWYGSPPAAGDTSNHNVMFTVNVTSNPQSYVACQYLLYYTPDGGQFNDDLNYSFTSNVQQSLGTADNSGYSYEWYSDSAYTTRVGTGSTYYWGAENATYQTDPTHAAGPIYMRYSQNGGSTWTNWNSGGAIYFTDPRF